MVRVLGKGVATPPILVRDIGTVVAVRPEHRLRLADAVTQRARRCASEQAPTMLSNHRQGTKLARQGQVGAPSQEPLVSERW